MNPAQYCNQTSGEVEYYTPIEITEAARLVMGCIDLDPASCAAANHYVRATNYFTQADDGLTQAWRANTLWMNHPYGDASSPKWIGKLVAEYTSGNIKQACAIMFASTSERFFRPLLNYPICFIAPRVNFLNAAGMVVKGSTKGACVCYLGKDVDRFVRYFHGQIMNSRYYGRVMVPYRVPDTVCAVCERGFIAKRTDSQYCSAACKQKAVRRRRSVITRVQG